MPPPSEVGAIAAAHAAAATDLADHALALVGPHLGRLGNPEGWRDAVADVGADLLSAQVAVAELADGYLDDVLAAQDLPTTALGRVAPEAFAGLVDGGGTLLRTLVFAPNSVAAKTDQIGRSAAIQRAQFVAQSILTTALADTERAATQSAMQARPSVTSYVRMLSAGACARCAVLAGRHYDRAVAFKRHKRCRCRHIPTSEDVGGDWATTPGQYFRSLSAAEQDRIFTAAGARAIRDGADISQVVNARKGISQVTAYGQNVTVTIEGTTRRGLAGQRLEREGTQFARTPGDRYFRSQTLRLMPEEIFAQAERLGWDRAETLRQLRRFAYIV